jgi:hypothetical protein
MNGTLKFQEAFNGPPLLLIALSGLNIDTGANTRVWCGVENVTQDGADWYIRSWADTKFNGATAQWTAIGPQDPTSLW